jgi:hypothetical protein
MAFPNGEYASDWYQGPYSDFPEQYIFRSDILYGLGESGAFKFGWESGELL